jgi:hypothetical protein
VRLALHTIGSRHSELDEACRQLLGLLALCPPVQVPWSLFDGWHDGTSTAELLVRGARVQVGVHSLQRFSPTGERCLVYIRSPECLQKLQGTVLSDDVVKSPVGKMSIRVRTTEDGEKTVNIIDVEFYGSHAVLKENGKWVLQNFTNWNPAKDVECTFTDLQKGAKGKKDKIVEKKALVADHIIDDFGAVSLREGDRGVKKVDLCKYVDLHPGLAIFKRMLVHCTSDLSSELTDECARNGRVLQRHEDDTVSVAFGCESGACLLRAPRARNCCVRDA